MCGIVVLWWCLCVCASLNVLGMKQQLHILENDNWSPRTYSGSMKVYRTISKHPTRLSGFFSMSSVDCKNAENAKWMTFWLSCPWKHETLKRLCKSVFSGTSELPASRCKCTYIDRCTYLSSICTFKNPDVSTMYYNLYISNLSNTFFFGLLTLSKTRFFELSNLQGHSINLSLSKLQLLASKNSSWIFNRSWSKDTKTTHPYPNTQCMVYLPTNTINIPYIYSIHTLSVWNKMWSP